MAELGPLLKALLAKAKGVKVLDKAAIKVSPGDKRKSRCLFHGV